MEHRALGKGLAALIPDNADLKKGEKVAYLKIDSIKNNAFQPRTHYDDTKLEELKISIKEKGVLQPILVREKGDGYEVVAGERRLRAVRALGLQEVPAIVKEVSDQEALVLALVENIQREELNPIEEAEAYKRLMEEFRYTQERVAESVGKDRSTVSNMLRLLKLPQEIKQSVYSGDLSVGHARALLSVEILSEQQRLFTLTMKKGLSVRELEAMVKPDALGGHLKGKAKKTKDRDVLALEESLQKILGTKVTILSQKKKGKIVVEYYSLEDLDRITEIIRR